MTLSTLVSIEKVPSVLLLWRALPEKQIGVLAGLLKDAKPQSAGSSNSMAAMPYLAWFGS
jgi:hypothetical protein